MLRVIRKADILLFCVLLLSAGLSAGLFAMRAAATGAAVVITLDGETYSSYSLEEDREIEVVTETGTNTVCIENKIVYMKYSDCHNQVCVEHAPISRSGESIICLPHRVVVQIEGGKEADVDAVAK